MKRDEQIRMLLHPEEYSKEQLDRMLDEAGTPVASADEAWERFRSEEIGAKRGKPMFLKIAAMFVGVLMLSGITYAAIHLIGNSQEKVQEEQTAAVANPRTDAQHVTLAPQDSTQHQPVVYENAELATILGDIATFYQLELVYKKADSKHIRLYFTWNKKQTIDDLIETFNKFERIHLTLDNKKLIVE